jgi:cytochrome bd-type quinol oxidase subunit 1
MDHLVIEGIIVGFLEVCFIGFMMYKINQARKESKKHGRQK